MQILEDLKWLCFQRVGSGSQVQISRGLWARIVCKKVNRLEARMVKELEVQPGGRSWLTGHPPPLRLRLRLRLRRAGGRTVPTFKGNYSTAVLFVKWLFVNGLFAGR
jgi:hypothetical protein